MVKAGWLPLLPANLVTVTSSQMGARNYVFTINNPTSQLAFGEGTLVRYCVWQKEQGTDGTPHYQGYLECYKPVRFTALAKEHPEFARAHFEKRGGTREQARDYCMKEDSRIEGPWEFGTFGGGGQGTRTDIKALKRKIETAKDLKEVWDEFPMEFLKYHRGIEKVKLMLTPKRDFMPQVYVIVGKSGAGKTSYAKAQLGDKFYVKQHSNWWDDYNGEDLLIDEFYGWITTDELLRLCDRYPMMVQSKGGQTQMLSKRIYITSNRWPKLWYKSWVDGSLPFEAFIRRVHQWIYFDSDSEMQICSTYQEFEEIAINDNYNMSSKFLENSTNISYVQ